MKFSELTLHPHLLQAIQKMGLEELTPIQERSLQPALTGKNIAGAAQTGTGKTIAFLLPILQHIFTAKPLPPTALIITPTRELCLQIAKEAQKLCALTQGVYKVCTLYGGTNYREQETLLKQKTHIIVATPGRLIDYLRQKKLSCEQLRFTVLDEADRMLDMGFIRDVQYIMRRVPSDTQIMLFSATLSYRILRLARQFMASSDNMLEIRIEAESVAVERIEQKLLHLSRDEKEPYLVHQIHAAIANDGRIIIFTNFRHSVEKLTRLLQRYGVAATGISSLLEQKKRLRLLQNFRSGECPVLVATDVASRGLDIDDLTHVFNYDLPQDAEAYVHRIGRTARAGKSGISISYCSEADYENLPRIERYIKQKIAIEKIQPEFLRFPQNGSRPLSNAEHDAQAGRQTKGPLSSQAKPPQQDGSRPLSNAEHDAQAGRQTKGPLSSQVKPPQQDDSRPLSNAEHDAQAGRQTKSPLSSQVKPPQQDDSRPLSNAEHDAQAGRQTKGPLSSQAKPPPKNQRQTSKNRQEQSGRSRFHSDADSNERYDKRARHYSKSRRNSNTQPHNSRRSQRRGAHSNKPNRRDNARPTTKRPNVWQRALNLFRK